MKPPLNAYLVRFTFLAGVCLLVGGVVTVAPDGTRITSVDGKTAVRLLDGGLVGYECTQAANRK